MLKIHITVSLQRASSVQLLGFLGTVEDNTCRFDVLLLFLSLKRGADLSRSPILELSVTFITQVATAIQRLSSIPFAQSY